MVRGKPNSHAEHQPTLDFRIDGAKLSELKAIKFLYSHSCLTNQLSGRPGPSSSCWGIERVYSYPDLTIIT
jgi:hypothetical protein